MASSLAMSATMETAVMNVLNQVSVTEFTIDIQLTNTTNKNFSYTPMWIDRLQIVQNFANNFADDLRIEFTVSPTEYQQLYAGSQGLAASVRFAYVNSQTATRVFTPAPVVRSYRAMIIDPQDLSKKYTTGALQPTQEMPLTEQHVGLRIPIKLHLIEIDVYTLRQQKFHGLFSKAKVADVIAFVIKSFGISQISMVPPDNTMTWEHIVVPPAQNIDEIFDYLHYTYGVYMKGIDWYYTNKILYLYPAYENNPIIKYTANIFNAPSGSYGGMLSYHTNSGTTLNVVSTTEVTTTDLSRPTAENAGTAVSFLRASSVIDRSAVTTPNGSFLSNDRSLTVNSTQDRTITPGANNPQYTKSTDNVFFQSSKLAKFNTILLKCGWRNAVPYLLYPGHNVKYHFDKQGVFTNQQGVLECAIYIITRQRHSAVGVVYSANALLQIRATSDVTTVRTN